MCEDDAQLLADHFILPRKEQELRLLGPWVVMALTLSPQEHIPQSEELAPLLQVPRAWALESTLPDWTRTCLHCEPAPPSALLDDC